MRSRLLCNKTERYSQSLQQQSRWAAVSLFACRLSPSSSVAARSPGPAAQKKLPRSRWVAGMCRMILLSRLLSSRVCSRGAEGGQHPESERADAPSSRAAAAGLVSSLCLQLVRSLVMVLQCSSDRVCTFVKC